MSKKMDRRGFLKALPFIPKAAVEEIKDGKPHEENVIRPPYISENSDFSNCVECDGACINVCDEKILYRREDGSPYIVFRETGCTFCKKCAESCEYEVLSLKNPEKIFAIFSIDTSKCFAWNGVMCFSCKEPCLDNAINFQGIFKPIINTQVCSGCGFCLSYCPANAIKVEPFSMNGEKDVS